MELVKHPFEITHQCNMVLPESDENTIQIIKQIWAHQWVVT